MMRELLVVLLATSAFASSAHAGDKPLIGPPEAWVKPVALPTDSGKSDDKPFHILLLDQQTNLEPGRSSVYVAFAVKIQRAEGLAAGNISFLWRPDTQTLTVHRILIHRGDKTIDVLAGQSFTVVRREKDLESATLDGELTANIQPEGLQVGDVLEYSTSTTSSDPVLKNHVEGASTPLPGIAVGRQHLRVQWPSRVAIHFRQGGKPATLTPVTAGDIASVELSQNDVAAPIPPKDAPPRYALRQLTEFSDFASWAEVGALFAPLYAKAATLSPQSPLQAELARIRAGSADLRTRAEAALALVENQTRYVALEMGAGGLVPTDADTTWTRRYGDCKAKTALLLALLHGLGIAADPVVVNVSGGDGMDQRQPMAQMFDHVLVRATIAGKVYWLDGTRTGDTSLDRLQVPNFGWGLPLLASGAALVRILPPPLEVPLSESSIRLDARAGIMAPALAHAEMLYRRDEAIGLNSMLSGLAADARDSSLRAFWRQRYDFIDIKSVSAAFDPKSGEERLLMDGTAHMEWNDGWYETDGTDVGYRADYTRDPGPDGDAPYAVAYPSFSRTVETIQLPPNFNLKLDPATTEVNEAVAGIEYRRHATVAGDTVTIERTARSLVPEFTAADAPAAQSRLRDLAKKTIYLKRPSGYQPNAGEVIEMMKKTPEDAAGFVYRGWALSNVGRYDEAIADFDHSTKLDPKNAQALADRAFAWLGKHDNAQAAKDIEAALAIDPKEASALRARGRMALDRHAYADAITAFTAALEGEPGTGYSLRGRASAYMGAGDLDAALRDANALIAGNAKDYTAYSLRAQIYDRQGKHGQALAEATALVANHPDDAEALQAAVFIDAGLNARAEAVQLVERAIAARPTAELFIMRASLREPSDEAGRGVDADAALKLKPDFAPANFVHALVLADNGDYRGSLPFFEKASALMPGSGAYQARWGLTYLALDDVESAAKHIDAAGVLDPVNPEVVRAKAALASRTGGVSAAITSLNGLLDRDPGNSGALANRAQLEFTAGDNDAALRDSAAVLKAQPTNGPMYLLRANIFKRLGRDEEGISEATAIAKALPAETWAQVAAANIYSAFHKNDEALQAYTRAIAIQPEAYIYVNRAVHRPKSDLAGRRADIDAALKLDPASADALGLRAVMQKESGDLAGAVATYTAAITAIHDNLHFLAERGVLFALQGDNARAAQDFAAARAQALTPEALNSICWTKATAGVALDSALEDCNAALAKTPTNSALLDSRALVLLRLGRIDDAIADYGRALATNPSQSASLYGRAVALARKGDRAKSDADLAAAVKIDPDVRERFAGYGVRLSDDTPAKAQ